MRFSRRQAVFGLAVCSLVCAQTKPPLTIAYGASPDGPLTLDYYRASGGGPHPAVILVHDGDAAASSSKSDSEVYLSRVLASSGFACFSINYRLAPRMAYPLVAQDVQRAVRFVRHEANNFEVDPAHIALLGTGGGGVLAGLAALQQGNRAGSKDPVDRTDATVQAVIAIAAPSDFRATNPAVLDETGALTEASVVMHLRADAPPFLLIHGDSDDLVDLSQSTHLQTALYRAGAACDLIIIPDGGHSVDGWLSLPRLRPWEHEIVNWLNELTHHQGRPAGVLRRGPQ